MSLDRTSCTLATCSVEIYGWYSYIPNVPANIVYLAIFGILAFAQLFLAIKYRVWGAFAGGLVLGCVTEAIGYVGRVLQGEGDGIFKKSYFVIQLVCLTIAPALISAPVYLSLGRIVKAYGRFYSLLAPRTYAIIFVCSDVVSLLLQAAGGALAATGKTEKKVNNGVHILVAGLAFQVLSLVIFMSLAGHFWFKVRRGGQPLNTRFETLRGSKQFKFFIAAIALATITILTRCIYRVVELAGGFRTHEANDQVALMILDGPMIMIAVAGLTICHPGPLFYGEWTRLGLDTGVPDSPDFDLNRKGAYETTAQVA
ncbi:hypothetical protein PRZ48_001461 [Zasmidium cellare]|uniref:Sphingoid long-chain base transporter RSB1 n=1 Tax=Zasmidium cellare TaxID=395010 RepID=A0ABR0F301_ZASCE|nr:hypothetical protein PRZ48_001461 [Zasmidium cellare]